MSAVPPSITVTTVLPASLEEAWTKLSDLADHVTWMADAHRIDFLTSRREGACVVMNVLTRVGPLRTRDRIEVTTWDPPHRIGVIHRGIVRGTGEFVLTELGGRHTQFTWSERLRFPAWLGGAVTAWLARPVLAWIWRRNLSGLQRQMARRSPGPDVP